jgi:asparagine synthase (glutamine-hydrolysing)
MSGLCGWLRRPDEISNDKEVIERMGRVLGRKATAPMRAMSAAWGGVAASGVSDAAACGDPQRLAAVWGDLRFEDARLQGLARDRSPAEALSTGYGDKGPAILQEVQGSFALAVLGTNGEALLAVDRMGTRPLCYTLVGDTLVFGSTLDEIDAYPGALRKVSQQALYDYVYFHVVPSPATIYEGRRRLLPGTYLKFRHGAVEVVPYWHMPFDEQETRPFPELKADFVNILRHSVSRWAAKGRIGAFLSGGTDSSTIAGMLRAVTGDAPRTYSIGFDADGFDEMRYARIAARHFATRHNEYYVSPADVVAAIPKIAAVHDQPFGNSSSVPTYYCAKLAKDDGSQIMLGGDGGDELFGGNSRYAVQYLYSLYSDLPEGLRTGLLEPVAFALPAVIAGKMQRYMRSATMPMPARYDKYNLVEHFGPEVVFTSEFRAQVDVEEPRCAMAQAYGEGRGQSLINRMLALDLKYTLADNDLPKVCRSCELAAIDVGFPMLDDALVAFSARLAPSLKLKGARLRYFFKQALRDFLPREILNKKKHGFGLPFGPWLQTHGPLRDLALDSLSDLKKRKIIQPAFIDELMSVHVDRHAGYFSTMVWVLMMLEHWFARSVSEAADLARRDADVLMMWRTKFDLDRPEPRMRSA